MAPPVVLRFTRSEAEPRRCGESLSDCVAGVASPQLPGFRVRVPDDGVTARPDGFATASHLTVVA